MSTNYPGALDSFVNPTATDTLDSATVPHAAQHDNINDAMSAVQVTLGVNPQGGSATVVARLTALDSTVSGKASLSAANTFTTGAQTIRTGADATKALILQRNSATQSANIVSVVQSDGTTELTRVRPIGQIGVGTLITNTALGINTDLVGDNRAIVIKAGQTTPTNNAIELLPLANNTPLMKVDFAGNITAPTFIGSLTGNASTATSATTASTVTDGVYTTDTGTVTSTMILDGTIVNADINASAAIADTKLAQITTANKVSGTAITSGNISTSGSITTSGSISTTGGGSITSATNVTAAGFNTTGTYAVFLGSAGSTGGNIVFATTGGTQSLIAATGGTGSQTLPATAGTILNSASAIDVAKITTGTTLPGNVVSSSLTTVGTIGSGTWQGTAIDKAYGGTGSTYGSLIIGHSQLNATVTKNANDTTPEAIFRTGTANSTIQYFNVDADTLYFFEGFIQLGKTSTSSVINTSLLYVQTGSTTALTEQSARLQVQYLGTTSLIGVGVANATATTATGTATTLTGVYCYFRGFIRTNATTAGRINLAQWLDTAGASAPTWIQGSYINLYKVGTGNAQTFGNWS